VVSGDQQTTQRQEQAKQPRGSHARPENEKKIRSAENGRKKQSKTKY
jgi:hypothetical protein